MALDLSMKSRKRSHRESDSGSPNPIIICSDEKEATGQSEGVALDLSVPGGENMHALSLKNTCSHKTPLPGCQLLWRQAAQQLRVKGERGEFHFRKAHHCCNIL